MLKRINFLKEIAFISYVAGFIDGEGCIMISRNKDKKNKTRHWNYWTRITISQTVSNESKKLFKKMVSFWGGNFWIPNSPSRKKFLETLNSQNFLFIYEIHHRKAEKLLKDVLPYLYLKKNQALLALNLAHRKGKFGKKSLSNKELKIRKLLWKNLKKLHGNKQKVSVP